MAGLTAINRKNFRGGGMDASTSSFDASANPGRSGGPIGRDDSAQDGMQGFTETGPGQYTGGDGPSKTIRDQEKARYVEQFSGITPTGGRPRTWWDTIKTGNNNIQRKANIKLALRRAYQKEKDLAKYKDSRPGRMSEVFGMGYDFSELPMGLENFISNKGTRIESTRPNQYDVNSFAPGVLGVIGDKVRPDTQITAQNTLDKMKAYMDLNKRGLKGENIKEELDALANLGRLPDPPGGDGDGPLPYIPIDYNTGVALPIDDVAEEKKFDYRFGTGQNVGANVLRGYAAEGGIMGTRARRAMGGIMGRLDQRQQFFLGGIGKAIGKVAKAAGKVLKSDVGKAALLYAGGVYLGGGNVFSAGAYNPMNFLGKKGYLANIAGKSLLKDTAKGFTKGNYSLGKILGLSAALPFIPGLNKVPKNEDIGMTDRGGGLIDPLTGQPAKPAEMRASLNNALENADGDPVRIQQINDAYAFLGPDERLGTYLPYRTYGVKDGGRIGKAEGGLMDLGGMEKDYRAEGGFVPIGEYEKKDDVPARLSVNEFVFTADAVRGAGGGDIDKGAEIMENMMENLEKGGTVSEESQGNAGAQQMFDTSERLGEVI